MGPSQICGCLFREPRVFTIAHIYIYTTLYNQEGFIVPSGKLTVCLLKMVIFHRSWPAFDQCIYALTSGPWHRGSRRAICSRLSCSRRSAGAWAQ